MFSSRDALSDKISHWSPQMYLPNGI